MAGVYDFLFNVGQLLAVLTVVTAANAAIRHRQPHRLDILLAVVSITSATFLKATPLSYVGWLLAFGQPFLLVRLVAHFRNVPRAVLTASLLLIPVQATVLLAWPSARPDAIDAGLGIWVAAVFLYAAAAFLSEARRASGVSEKRLAFAAFGTAILATRGSLLAWAVFLPSLNVPLGTLSPALTGSVLICYFFAFSTPRRLAARWQRAEQAKYLSATAARDAEDRGRHVAEDLASAAAGSVNNAVTLVALRDTPDAGPLIVRTSTLPGMVDVVIPPGAGIVGRLLETGAPLTAPLSECEPVLVTRLKGRGDRVLAAPVSASAHTWGVVLVVQRRGSLFPDDDLHLLTQVGRYAGMALDHAHLIAERRDRERRAADRRLREVESRMSLMLDSIKDYALFVIDHHGRVVSWQAGAEQVFGQTAYDMRDAQAAPLFGLSPSEFLAWLERAREIGHAEREGPCHGREGRIFTGATVIRRLTGDDDLDGFVAVTHDVTEHRSLEERLRQSQKLEAVGLLAGGVAHDFNNLLTAILGYADLLYAGCPATDPRRKQIGEIQHAAERAAGLTQQLLAFSRRQTLQSSVLSLSTVLSDLLPILGRLVGDRIAIVDATDPKVAPILADRSQLELVIVNLLTNARDAMPDGGRVTIRTASVALDADAAGGEVPVGTYVELEIADTGIGMGEETRARIFEPFFTTKEMGRGTGLGLATVYGIVRQLGGMVRVESQPGHGTTFRLYFPENAEREGIVEMTAAPRPGIARTGTLLLVEDDPAVRSFLRQSLERDGFQVLVAEHQRSAMELVAAHTDPIALVITDVVMPGGSGPELVTALGKVRPGVPALFISGYADTVLSVAGPLPPSSHFLQKPFSSADLLARVRHILAQG